MTGHNYPDHFYADALARDEKPLGAYRSTDPEMPEAERKLRTALAYVSHARDLINDALAIQHTALKGQTQPTRCDPERVPKWDPKWGVPLRDQKGYSEGSVTGGFAAIYQNQPPNCDGLSARDIRAPHPMQAEVIRDHDERLAGGESHL